MRRDTRPDAAVTAGGYFPEDLAPVADRASRSGASAGAGPRVIAPNVGAPAVIIAVFGGTAGDVGLLEQTSFVMLGAGVRRVPGLSRSKAGAPYP